MCYPKKWSRTRFYSKAPSHRLRGDIFAYSELLVRLIQDVNFANNQQLRI